MTEKRIKLTDTQWAILVANENEMAGIKSALEIAQKKQQQAIALILDVTGMSGQQFQVDPQTQEMIFQVPDKTE